MAIESLRLDNSTSENKLAKVTDAMFDWSGVISDDRPPVYESNMRMGLARGLPRVPLEEWLPTTQLNPVEYFRALGIEVEPEEVYKEYQSHFRQVRLEGIHPVVYSDAEEVLGRLSYSGIKIKIVSSHPEELLREEAFEYGLERYIAKFIGSSKDKGVDISEECRISQTSDKSRVVYSGDTIFDIRAARAAGVVAVGISTGYHSYDRLMAEDHDYVFPSMSYLSAAILNR